MNEVQVIRLLKSIRSQVHLLTEDQVNDLEEAVSLLHADLYILQQGRG